MNKNKVEWKIIKADGNTVHMDDVRKQKEPFLPYACFNSQTSN